MTASQAIKFGCNYTRTEGVQAILSKIERGQRNANREQVIKLARFFNINETDLLVSWLSDKLVYEVRNEDVALKALQLAEEKVKYQKMKKL